MASDPTGRGHAARRIACVELPGYALQIVAHAEPGLRDAPCVVLDRDDPEGRVQGLNRSAHDAGIRPAMRYAMALSLVGSLQARVVTDALERSARSTIVGLLRDSGPAVETSRERPGVFWVDASGLPRGHLHAWGETLRARLHDAGWAARVAIGFSRAGTLGGVLGSAGVRVFDAPDDEDATLATVPLRRLGLPRDDLMRLERLGLRTLGCLRGLDRDALRRRFDPDLVRMLDRLRADDPLPLCPPSAQGPEQTTVDWELPESRAFALVDACEEGVVRGLRRLRSRGLCAARIDLALTLDDRSDRTVEVAFSEPLDQWPPIRALLLLRLERTPPRAGVCRLTLSLHGRAPQAEQQSLFRAGSVRDLAAGTRALDRVRAHLGDHAVFVLEPTDGHLPEQRMRRAPVRRVTAPRPPHPPRTVFIRQLLDPPRPLPHAPWDAPDGVLLPGLGATTHTSGPWTLEGGWWGTPWNRDYFYIETADGQILWIFHDRRAGGWFLHGRIA
jgi:protein ImuB